MYGSPKQCPYHFNNRFGPELGVRSRSHISVILEVGCIMFGSWITAWIIKVPPININWRNCPTYLNKYCVLSSWCVLWASLYECEFCPEVTEAAKMDRKCRIRCLPLGIPWWPLTSFKSGQVRCLVHRLGFGEAELSYPKLGGFGQHKVGSCVARGGVGLSWRNHAHDLSSPYFWLV